MKKKKSIIAIILLVITLMCLSCSDGKEKQISNEEAIKYVDSLKLYGTFDSTLNGVDENVVINSYKITNKNIQVLKAFMGDGASSEEIVLLKGNKKDIKSIVKDYLMEKEDNYNSYLPKEADKINNAVVRQFGEYTIVCISADSKKAEEILS